jgi:exonuclease III
MQQTYKITTINTNGISSNTRMGMLGDFLRRQDKDIALLQEVTHTSFESIGGYTAIINEGTDKRGTAILAKEDLTRNNIKRLPSGRGLAAMFSGTWIINVFAPSGAEGRFEREHFFNKSTTYLLPTTINDILMAGDFNCVTPL